LDEITARDLREDLLKISEQLQQTILFVTHNAMEAAFLADRVAVMSQRPAEITAVLENPLPYPRDLEDPELLEFEQQIVTELGV
jgi:ABC-type nitrate/sulfonate/bicarbonate transport system ATPase subunit